MEFGNKEKRMLGAGGYYFSDSSPEEIKKDNKITNGFDRYTITNTQDAESTDIDKSYKKNKL